MEQPAATSGNSVSTPKALNDLAFQRLERPLDDLVDIWKVPGNFGGTSCQHPSRRAFAPPFAAV
jgi:hypothetical protein